MNATILAIRVPVVAVPRQAPSQESSQNGRVSTDSAAGSTATRDFTGALDRASAKQNRKDDAAKPAAGKRSGDALPPPGSVAPPGASAPLAAPGLPVLPAQLWAQGGPSAASSSVDEAGDDDSGPSASGAVVATTPSFGAPAVTAAGSNADPAPVADSPPGTTAMQGSVFDGAMPDLDSEPATDGASPPAPAPATALPSNAAPVPAAATAPLPAKPQAAVITAGSDPTMPKPMPGSSLPTLSRSGAGGGSAAGRAGAQNAAPGVSATPPTDDSAGLAQTPAASSALTDLALIEGSDATGSAASALQAATAAASVLPAAAPAPFTVLQFPLTSAVGAGSGASAAAPDSAAVGSSALASLGGGDARGHNGASDSGSDTGAGFLANGDGAAALQQLNTNSASLSNDAAPVPTMNVHADVDGADFPQGVADKVSLAVDNGWSSAKLSVNPPQLGPIELQIAVQGAHAQVAMSTHSAVTREALESSVPTLRDMLSSQGFTQVSVDISQRSFQERAAPEQPYGRASGGPRETAAVGAPPSARVVRTPLGVLDTYA